MQKQQLVVVWFCFAIALCFAQYGVTQSSNHILNGEYIMTLHLGYGERSEAEFSAEYISMNFDGRGNGTLESVYSSSGFITSEPFTYSAKNDGTFSFTVNLYDYGVVTLHGIVSSDGESFTMWPFSVGFKKSSDMSETSLSGDYIATSYVTEESESGAQYIFMNFAGDGSGTYEILQSSIGDSGAIGSFTYSINENGSFFFTDDDSISHFRGIVRSDGECFTMVQVDSSEFGIYAGIKKSSGLSNASLSGEYIMTQYLTEEETSTEYFLVTFDGVGNGISEMIHSSGGDTGTFPFTYSVNDDGTGFFWVTSGDSVDHLSFIVSYDGETITMAASSSRGFGIYFGIAKSDKSAHDASDYYPMEVGNYWIMRSDSLFGEYNPTLFKQDVEVIDLISGEEHFRIKHTLIDGFDWSSYYWFRIDSAGIMMKAQGDTSDINVATIYDAPLLWMPNGLSNVGFTWEWDIPLFDFSYEYSVESVSENVQVPAGVFNNCLLIRTIMTDTLGNTMQQDAYYAKDVGEVLMVDSRMGRFELVEYSLQSDVENERTMKEFPVRFSLKQNYPNPFNPTTTIEFGLARASNVSLRIYDVSGKLVRTVVNEWKEAGFHSVVWDGKDRMGNSAASGVYFFRIENDKFSKTKRMLLLK